VVETSARLGLEVLTLYAFSIENWKRPRAEVTTLMSLLKHYLRAELQTLLRNDIRFQVIGRPGSLPADVIAELERGTEATRNCGGLVFNIALNYGGRSEITDAVRRLLVEVAEGRLDPESVDEQTIADRLYTGGLPDPDLLIRTSGELRVSNFLLWQIAYSEIWVTDVLWPDFRRPHLLQAISDFQKRNRRYGGIVEPAPAAR
jgi:undecaprenyl diphosphate synthase